MYLKARIGQPVEFISGGQFVSEGEWIHARRSLDSFEIIIGVKGTLPIQQGTTKYSVNPGDVLLLLPGYTHYGYEYTKEPISFYWFHFYCIDDYAILKQNEAELQITLIKRGLNTNLDSQNAYIPIFSKFQNIERIYILFHQLMHMANSNYYTQYGVDYLTTLLLIEFSQQTITNLKLPDEQSATKINLYKIIEWIRAHYMKNITVMEIAEIFNYNPDYLSRAFKKKMGMNLQTFIHLQKLDKAKELLVCNSRESVAKIANSLGFEDEKYFMRLFKQYEKLTPTEYRKAYYRTHYNNH